MINSPFPQTYATSPYPSLGIKAPFTQQVEQPLKNHETELPRYVNYLADYGGCGHWRVLWAEQVINAKGIGISTSLSSMVFQKDWYKGIKCIKLQRQAGSHQLEFVKFLKGIQEECGFRLVYEIDDVVFAEDIPDYNKFKPAFNTPEIRQNAVDIINLCDEVVVTCDFMRRLYEERTGKKEITVIPNFPPASWLGRWYNPQSVYRSYTNNKAKPRILYAGSGAHYDVGNKTGGKDDFSDILDYVIETREKFQWVFVGAFPPPLLPYIKDGSIEFHKWQSMLDYPKLLSELQVQLMIAPLEDNNFNRAKSDIKFIEAATLGIPCLCQRMVTYESCPESLRFTGIDEFRQKVEATLKWNNRKTYKHNIKVLHDMGAKRALENPENIGCHVELYNTEYGSQERKFLAKWN